MGKKNMHCAFPVMRHKNSLKQVSNGRVNKISQTFQSFSYFLGNISQKPKVLHAGGNLNNIPILHASISRPANKLKINFTEPVSFTIGDFNNFFVDIIISKGTRKHW